MVKSMTGYGRCELTENQKKFTVEIKSVNNRYLDVNIRMPRQFNQFEAAIRTELKNYISRGKVDIYISFEDMGEVAAVVKYNRHIAQEYLQYLHEMAEDFGLKDDISVSVLSQYPDVFTMESTQEEAEPYWDLLRRTVSGAAQAFLDTRAKEGAFLHSDITAKLDGMAENVAFLTKRAPEIVAEYQQQLTRKIEELVRESGIEESRILQEVAIYSDRICIDEELVRLGSHIGAMRDTLMLDESVGRKLDFLAQEMNREANTILSKTTDVESSDRAINLKTEIEKIREQIQNIE